MKGSSTELQPSITKKYNYNASFLHNKSRKSGRPRLQSGALMDFEGRKSEEPKKNNIFFRGVFAVPDLGHEETHGRRATPTTAHTHTHTSQLQERLNQHPQHVVSMATSRELASAAFPVWLQLPGDGEQRRKSVLSE